METNEKDKGIVYLLTNECMPGLVKIGMTSREDMEDRLKELYTTGVPVPFECVYACKVGRFKELEKALHTAFDPQRVNPSREFFRIKPEQAIAILQLFNEGNITAEVVKEIEKDEDPDYSRKKRSRHDFIAMGLKQGDLLVYRHDPTKTCTVNDRRTVIYEGNVTALTPITTQLMGTKYAVQPCPHWTFNGRCLSEFYEDWQESLKGKDIEETEDAE